jgi:hypothetical protein
MLFVDISVELIRSPSHAWTHDVDRPIPSRDILDQLLFPPPDLLAILADHTQTSHPRSPVLDALHLDFPFPQTADDELVPVHLGERALHTFEREEDGEVDPSERVAKGEGV